MTRKPKEKWLTRKSARLAEACYSDARLAELIPARGMSIARAAQLKIPGVDRVWALKYACNWPEAVDIWCRARRYASACLEQGGFKGAVYDASIAIADAHLLRVANGAVDGIVYA
jgi:hypothetical protein